MKGSLIRVLCGFAYGAAIFLLHYKKALCVLAPSKFQFLTQHRTFQADREKRPHLA